MMARIGAEALIQRMIIKTSINEDSKTLIETLNRQAFTINIIFRVDGFRLRRHRSFSSRSFA